MNAVVKIFLLNFSKLNCSKRGSKLLFFRPTLGSLFRIRLARFLLPTLGFHRRRALPVSWQSLHSHNLSVAWPIVVGRERRAKLETNRN
jgi:hypothetical protein